MLDLDSKSQDKSDFIKADGKKFYVSSKVPARLVFGVQAIATSMADIDTSDSTTMHSKYKEIMDFMKSILYIDKRNDEKEVDKMVDNLTFEQLPVVASFIGQQITNTAKKKIKKNGK